MSLNGRCDQKKLHALSRRVSSIESLVELL